MRVEGDDARPTPLLGDHCSPVLKSARNAWHSASEDWAMNASVSYARALVYIPITLERTYGLTEA